MAFSFIKRKISLIAFSQYRIGGVQTFWFNIFSQDIYNSFKKKMIFCNRTNEGSFKKIEKWHVCDEVIFDYSSLEEEYIYRKRLNKLIDNNPGVLLTNFALELKSITPLQFKNKTIFHITHDKEYCDIAVKFAQRIDVFIAHNFFFIEELRKRLPDRYNDIYYLPYGVPISPVSRKPNQSDRLRILFLARLDNLKGIYDIPIIDDLLKERGLQVEWTILGDGSERDKFYKQIEYRKNFKYGSPLNLDKIQKTASLHDLFILPSRLDGLPVSMLETMSVGLVPIISNFNPGISKIIDSSLGYILPIGDNKKFAEIIAKIHSDREDLERKSKACKEKIYNDYNISINSQKYFELFSKYKELKKENLRTKETLKILECNETNELSWKLKSTIKHLIK